MFSKKNKQAPADQGPVSAPQMPAMPTQPLQPTHGQSLFAPGLNPAPARIDFFLAPTHETSFHEMAPQPLPTPTPEITPLQPTEYLPDPNPDYIPDYVPNPSNWQPAQPIAMDPQQPTLELPVEPQSSWPTMQEPSQFETSYAAPSAIPEWSPAVPAMEPDPDWQPATPIEPVDNAAYTAETYTNMDSSAQVSDLYPAEYAPPQPETWQAPPQMELPPEVPQIYPTEYVNPGATDNVSAEALWHQLQPTASQAGENPVMPVVDNSDFEFSGDFTANLPETAAPAWELPAGASAPHTFDSHLNEPDKTVATPEFGTYSSAPMPEMSFETQAPGQNAMPVPAAWSPAMNSVTWEPVTPLQEGLPVSTPELAPSADMLPDDYPAFSFEESYHEPVQPMAAPDASLWQNLADPTNAPGEQVPADPLSSGQFLDAVNGQLYPADPFPLDPVSLSEGERAFEDAAQFLFPETVGADLDWGDTTDRAPYTPDEMSFGRMPEAPSVELGPSYQMEPGQFDDISASYGESPEPVSFQPNSAPAASVDAPEAFNLPPLPQPTPPAAQPTAEINLPPLDLFAPPPIQAESLELAPESPILLAPMDLQTTLVGEAPALPPIADADFSPGELWFPEGIETTEPVSPLAQAQNPTLAGAPLQDPSFFEEQDFYRPSYTLDEQGAIVPDHGEYMMPAAAPETSAHPSEVQGLWESPTPSHPETPPQEYASWNVPAFTEADAAEPYVSPAFEDEDDDVPVYALDNLTTSAAPTQHPVPDPDLDTTWNIATETSQSAAVSTAGGLSLQDLEILGVCGLDGDKRLLLVQNKGLFALMGQAGAQDPQVGVLKIFEQNPIAYQNTFTAVQEGQAGSQGMFVTQVGTWHGIISTFQDKIMLHTELG